MFPAASGPYSATVRLPVTDFSLRANSVVREPQIQAYWEQENVYEALLQRPGAVRPRKRALLTHHPRAYLLPANWRLTPPPGSDSRSR